MASSSKTLVTIKGIKEGLLFILDDAAPLTDVFSELSHKLEHTHSQFLNGPLVHVIVRLGGRPLTQDIHDSIRQIFAARGNLVVQSIESEAKLMETPKLASPAIKTISGIVRSGQTLHSEEDLLLIGDVNPGGLISSGGNILILGSLRGVAHAGVNGNTEAVIAASYLRPTQLRIAGVVSRPPDEWGFQEAYMEFAYLRDASVMEIDKMHQLHRIRPQLGRSKGE